MSRSAPKFMDQLRENHGLSCIMESILYYDILYYGILYYDISYHYFFYVSYYDLK